jgi:hypothetical protein
MATQATGSATGIGMPKPDSPRGGVGEALHDWILDDSYGCVGEAVRIFLSSLLRVAQKSWESLARRLPRTARDVYPIGALCGTQRQCDARSCAAEAEQCSPARATTPRNCMSPTLRYLRWAVAAISWGQACVGPSSAARSRDFINTPVRKR